MKAILSVSFFFCFICLPAFSQNAQTVPEAIRFIKLGNTLRAVDKPDQAISLLLRALPAVASVDAYWEAVAYENLGLASADQENALDAVRYFQKALDIYAKLKYSASQAAMRELIEDIAGTNLYAGVDIGSSGVKLAIFRTRFENGFYTKDIKLKPDAPNVTLISGTAQSFKLGQDVMKVYLDSIRRYNIPNERIFIAFSSGINEGLGKTPGMKKKLFDLLMTQSAIGSLKIDTTLTPAREAELFTIGAVPRKVWRTSSSIDIGSGNTKGGYFDANRIFHAVSFPLGTKSLALQIENKRSLTMDAYKLEAQKAVKAIADTSINIEFNINNPGLQQRKTVALGGGIAWAMVTYLFPDKANQTAVPVTMEDVNRFKKLAMSSYETLIQPDLTNIIDSGLRNKAAKDVTNVQNQFNEKQLIAGALLLDALFKAYTSSTVPKRIVFIRDSDISWVTGKFIEDINQDYEKKLASGGR